MASLKQADLGTISLTAGAEPTAGYRLCKRLGGGGFGEVWEAEGPGGFHVALKFVSLGERAGQVELRSLEILKGIHHPNLLVTFGAWESNGYLIIAMELADGTLWDRFQEAVDQALPGIPREELHEYILEAAKGIDHLNAQKHDFEGESGIGVQHRDIKPQNILLVGGGVKVADFGLARFLKHAITHHTGCLTPAYAAPEFFRGQTSSHSDQYSLAATYCHLRCGRPPHSGTASEVMYGHLNGLPELTALPAQERPAVARALAKEPAERWPSCRAFAEALRGNLSPAGYPTPIPGSSTPSWARLTGSQDEAPQTCGPAPYPAGTSDTLSPNLARADTAAAYSTAPGPAIPPRRSGRNIKVWLTLTATLLLGSAVGAVAKLHPFKLRSEALDPVPLTANQSTANQETQRIATTKAAAAATKTASGSVKATASSPRLHVKVPLKLTLRAGERRRFEVQLIREFLAGPVAIHLEGLPAGLAATEATVPASECTAGVEIVAADDAVATSQVVKLIASAGSSRADATLHLIVRPKAKLQVVELPGTLVVRAGKETAFKVNIRRDAFKGPVSVSFPGLPKGVTIEPATIPAANESADLKVVATADVEEAERLVQGTAAALTAKAEAPVSLAIKVVSAPFHRSRGDALANRAEYVRAIAEYTEAIRIDPEDTVALVGRGLAYQAQRQYGLAVADYSAGLRLSQDAVIYCNRAETYSAMREYDLALADYAQALRLDSRSALTHNGRGHTLFLQRKYAPAIAEYTEALELNGKYVLAYRNRAAAYIALRDYENAIADYSAVIRLRPKSVPAYNGRGSAYRDKGDLARALADYAQALHINPKLALTHYLKADVHLRLKEYNRCINEASQAIRLNPKLTEAWNCRASAYSSKKDFDSAIRDYTKAIELSPRYAKLYENRAVAYQAKGLRDKARADLAKYHQLMGR